MVESVPYPIFETESLAEVSVISSMVDEDGNRRPSIGNMIIPKGRSKNIRKKTFTTSKIHEVKEQDYELEESGLVADDLEKLIAANLDDERLMSS